MKKVLCLIGIIISVSLYFTGCQISSAVRENNASFGKAIEAIDTDKVLLNDITEFDWDTLYTFLPYTSKEDIQKIVGFESDGIIGNMINEGMTHLLFVKNKKVVCSILGYANNLQYGFSFGAYWADGTNHLIIKKTDNAVFSVEKDENGIQYLEHIV